MNVITPRSIKMIQAVLMLAKDGYEGDEIPSLLRTAAEQIDGKKFVPLNMKYNPTALPQNDAEWMVFNAALGVIWKRNEAGKVYNGDTYHKIAVIKVVREQTQMGLKESKDFVDANWNKFTLS